MELMCSPRAMITIRTLRRSSSATGEDGEVASRVCSWVCARRSVASSMWCGPKTGMPPPSMYLPYQLVSRSYRSTSSGGTGPTTGAAGAAAVAVAGQAPVVATIKPAAVRVRKDRRRILIA
jgi:hypothetical protein